MGILSDFFSGNKLSSEELIQLGNEQWNKRDYEQAFNYYKKVLIKEILQHNIAWHIVITMDMVFKRMFKKP